MLGLSVRESTQSPRVKPLPSKFGSCTEYRAASRAAFVTSPLSTKVKSPVDASGFGSKIIPVPVTRFRRFRTEIKPPLLASMSNSQETNGFSPEMRIR